MVLENRKRILVVDDSSTVRKMLTMGLTSLGYEVSTAEDGNDALNVLDKTRVDLVLTDLNMPNLDGFGLIRKIREKPAMAVLPVIVLTSKDDSVSMRAALDAGANIYLHKPAPLPKLKYKVQSLLADSSPAASRFTDTLKLASPAPAPARLSSSARARALAPEIQLESYLLAGSDDEAAAEFDQLKQRDDVTPSMMLPFMLDASIGDEGRIRLFNLMAAQHREDYTLPLLHKYYDFENPRVRTAAIRALSSCGGPEFLPDVKEIYDSETQVTLSLDEDHRTLFQAFEDVIAQMQAAADAEK